MSQTTAEQALRQQGLEALRHCQWDNAISIFSRMLTKNGNNVEALAALGRAYSQKGRHAQALKLVDRSVQLMPGSAALHFNRAVALELAGKKLQAGEAYEATLRLNPLHAEAKRQLQALEASLAGGGLPMARPEEASSLPPTALLPSAELDDELPLAKPDESAISAQSSVRKDLRQTGNLPHSKAAGSPPDGKQASSRANLRTKVATRPAPVSTPVKAAAIIKKPARAPLKEAIIVEPIDDDEILDVLPADED